MGRFEIPEIAFEHPEIVHEILDRVIVLEARFHCDDCKVHYLAIGPFAIVHESEEAPHYIITCDRRLIERPLNFEAGTCGTDWFTEKLYNCIRCYDEKTVKCSRCNGCGESVVEGCICKKCNGKGEVVCPMCRRKDDASI